MTEKQLYELCNLVSGLIAEIGRKHETVTWLIAYFQHDLDYDYYQLATLKRDEIDYRKQLLTLEHISDMLFEALGLEK